jgi:hypothetical protein
VSEFFEPQQPFTTPPPTYQYERQPPVQATIHHQYHRESIKWSQLAPYLVACAAVAVATATLFIFLNWRGSMQAQVDQLRHQVAMQQAQMTAAADSGQSQINSLSRSLKGLRGDLNTLGDQVGPYNQTCTATATNSSGAAAVVKFMCR